MKTYDFNIQIKMRVLKVEIALTSPVGSYSHSQAEYSSKQREYSTIEQSNAHYSRQRFLVALTLAPLFLYSLFMPAFLAELSLTILLLTFVLTHSEKRPNSVILCNSRFCSLFHVRSRDLPVCICLPLDAQSRSTFVSLYFG